MEVQTLNRIALCGAALLALAGCQSIPDRGDLAVSPVVPGPNETIIRDQIVVLVDVTGSIGAGSRYRNEMRLVEAFAAAMPDGGYEAGLDSFSGVSMSEWVLLPLETYSRNRIESGAAAIEPLGSLTPLDRAVRRQSPEFEGKGGRGALLVFSDGRETHSDRVLEACRYLKSIHGGELCIYTVNTGESAEGASLLQEMASVNGCGKYYDGEALHTPEAIHGLVRDIFIGPKAEVPPPAPAPAVLTLRNVYFDNDSAVIKPQYHAVLDEAVALLKANSVIKVRLDGHTDSNASDAYNQRLSERRVNAVRDALVQRGADAARLVTGAHGEAQPAAPNDTAANRQQNRRVELTVVE